MDGFEADTEEEEEEEADMGDAEDGDEADSLRLQKLTAEVSIYLRGFCTSIRCLDPCFAIFELTYYSLILSYNARLSTTYVNEMPKVK